MNYTLLESYFDVENFERKKNRKFCDGPPSQRKHVKKSLKAAKNGFFGVKICISDFKSTILSTFVGLETQIR